MKPTRWWGFAALAFVVALAPACRARRAAAGSPAPVPISCPTGVGAAASDAAQAAHCLYQAWAEGNRDKAAVFASLDVVGNLFRRPRPPADATFEGCFRDAGTGAEVCRLAHAGMTYQFDVRRSEGGWRVTG